MHSTVLGHDVLTPHMLTVVLDPKHDFFAGTVAGACILSQRKSVHPEELILGHVYFSFAQEWPP